MSRLKTLKPNVRQLKTQRTRAIDVATSWGGGRGGRQWRKLRERIFIRDRFVCQICKAKGKLTAIELHGPNYGVCDHIVPISQGGSDDPINLQTICQRCDKTKTQAESRGEDAGGCS